MMRRSIFFLLAASLFVAQLFLYRRFFHDDAYISLRYARNLIEGHGLVFNPGERIEGYTNFLWVMLLAAAGRLGFDLEHAARGLGCAFSVATLALLCFAFGSRRDRSQDPSSAGVASSAGAPSSAGVAALLLAANSGFAIWSWGGLETTCVAFLVTLAMLLSRSAIDPGAGARSWVRGGFAGAVGAAAVMTRPDSLLLVGGFGLLVGFGAWRMRLWSPVLLFAGAFLAVLVPYVGWKASYYGELLPNTFYVKSGSSPFKIDHGLQYTGLFLKVFGLPLLIILLAGWAMKDRMWAAICGLTVLVFCAYIVRTGGDHMLGFRFFVPVLPLLYLLVEKSLGAALRSKVVMRGNKPIAFAFLGVCLFAGPVYTFVSSEHYLWMAKDRDPAAFWGAHVGRWAKQNWPEGSLVALNSAGATPYFSRLRVVDMLGLVDPVIARREVKKIRTRLQRLPGHGKGDGRYVLSREPDYLILGPAGGCNPSTGVPEPWFLSDLEIVESPSFEEDFRQRTVWIPVDPEEVAYYAPHHPKVDKMRFVYFERTVPRRATR